MYVTNRSLNDRREPKCIAVSPERKYYRDGNTFVKRSLRTTEWQINPVRGVIHVPRQGRERVLNEASAMRYIADNTNIPIPKLHCDFEDDGAVYLVMEYVEGNTMDQLSADPRKLVQLELDRHNETLHGLKSRIVGGKRTIRSCSTASSRHPQESPRSMGAEGIGVRRICVLPQRSLAAKRYRRSGDSSNSSYNRLGVRWFLPRIFRFPFLQAPRSFGGS